MSTLSEQKKDETTKVAEHGATSNPEKTLDQADTAVPSQTTDQEHNKSPTVSLRVGTQILIIPQPGILTKESPYFEKLLSEKGGPQVDANGCFVIDCDADVFKHILHYLRYDEYPLCLDSVQSIDIAMYQRVRAAAEYFEIRDLAQWVQYRRYREVVTVKYKQEFWAWGKGSITTDADHVWFHHVANWQENVYHCPQNLPGHHSPEICDQANRITMHLEQCRPHHQGGWAAYWRKKEVPGTLMRLKRVHVDHEALKRMRKAAA